MSNESNSTNSNESTIDRVLGEFRSLLQRHGLSIRMLQRSTGENLLRTELLERNANQTTEFELTYRHLMLPSNETRQLPIPGATFEVVPDRMLGASSSSTTTSLANAHMAQSSSSSSLVPPPPPMPVLSGPVGPLALTPSLVQPAATASAPIAAVNVSEVEPLVAEPIQPTAEVAVQQAHTPIPLKDLPPLQQLERIKAHWLSLEEKARLKFYAAEPTEIEDLRGKWLQVKEAVAAILDDYPWTRSKLEEQAAEARLEPAPEFRVKIRGWREEREAEAEAELQDRAARWGTTPEALKALYQDRPCRGNGICFSGVRWPAFHPPAKLRWYAECAVCFETDPSFYSPCGMVCLCKVCALKMHWDGVKKKKHPFCPICKHRTPFYRCIGPYVFN